MLNRAIKQTGFPVIRNFVINDLGGVHDIHLISHTIDQTKTIIKSNALH